MQNQNNNAFHPGTFLLFPWVQSRDTVHTLFNKIIQDRSRKKYKPLALICRDQAPGFKDLEYPLPGKAKKIRRLFHGKKSFMFHDNIIGEGPKVYKARLRYYDIEKITIDARQVICYICIRYHTKREEAKMQKIKREAAILLRVSKKEKKTIEERASRENFSCTSDFMRKVILDRVEYKANSL